MKVKVKVVVKNQNLMKLKEKMRKKKGNIYLWILSPCWIISLIEENKEIQRKLLIRQLKTWMKLLIWAKKN